ncbi:MAG: hypothetical protein FWG87_12520 [Defluviitaleaceae bacterium]|nr:hypothetical protein [Defluviitaleaceae bacterium]
MQHTIDTLFNQDKVVKESLSLYKGGSLAFLDEALDGEVTEILSTEITETTTKKAYGDKALKLSTNKGISTEWEAEISTKDMLRFASYNIDLSREHKIPFTTVIITTRKPSVTSYSNPSLTFTPKIINLKERDADKELTDIHKKLQTGEKINELILLYLPLYGSKSGKTTAELLDTAIKLTPRVARDDTEKCNKLQSLMLLLNSTFLSDEELFKIMEANRMVLEDNRAVRVLADMGRRQGLEQAVVNMLRRGRDIQEISEDTGVEISRIIELQSELYAQNA